MNPFETTLFALKKEADELKAEETALNGKAQLFNEKIQGFLKESGLPDNFTLPELALLAIRKSRG